MHGKAEVVWFSGAQEEQRRVSNRETVRDGFFALLRDALASADPFNAAASLGARGSGQTLLEPGALSISQL
jgi:hypothetical protein